MHERYLGDSYDIVKRYWGQLLSPIAPVCVHPRFVPQNLQDAFTKLTNIPVWVATDDRDEQYSLLLDPHTGIPLPDAANQDVRISHAPIEFIARLFDDTKLAFVICFDQTTNRQHDLSIHDQRDSKRDALAQRGVFSFYYLSHAPFLFASKSRDVLNQVRHELLDAGIPESTSLGTRVQTISDATEQNGEREPE